MTTNKSITLVLFCKSLPTDYVVRPEVTKFSPVVTIMSLYWYVDGTRHELTAPLLSLMKQLRDLPRQLIKKGLLQFPQYLGVFSPTHEQPECGHKRPLELLASSGVLRDGPEPDRTQRRHLSVFQTPKNCSQSSKRQYQWHRSCFLPSLGLIFKFFDLDRQSGYQSLRNFWWDYNLQNRLQRYFPRLLGLHSLVRRQIRQKSGRNACRAYSEVVWSMRNSHVVGVVRRSIWLRFKAYCESHFLRFCDFLSHMRMLTQSWSC